MKANVIILVPIFFISLNMAYSQDQLKQFVFNIGGSLSYTSTKTSSPTSYKYGYTKTEISELTPTFAIFLVDRFQVGVSWSYLYASSKGYDPDGTYSGGGVMTKQISYGINIRYYYPIDKHAVFIGGGYAYDVYLDNHVGHSYIGESGFDLFVSQSIAVEPSVRYIQMPMEGFFYSTYLLSLGLRYFFL